MKIKLNSRFFFYRKKLPITLLNAFVILCLTNAYGAPSNKATDNSVEQYTQKLRVEGIVTDANGQPLTGANIIEKGTTNGVQADFDGGFTIGVSNENAILVVSFMGFVTKEVPVNTQSPMTIVLEEDISQLEEVVVVGYGTQKKENVTGAVTQIGEEIFNDRATPDIGTSLQGALPNLNINIYNGSPNAEPDFNIRGFESINGGSPLILVDGVPYDTLNDFNPADIESVTILKDAASAAIYGARGAFGVILVTTKNGEKEMPTKVNFSVSSTFSDMIIRPNPLNSVESATAANLARTNKGQSPLYDDEHIQYMQNYIDDPINNPSYYLLPNGNYQTAGNVDIYEQAYADYALRTTANLSLSGGQKKSTYYASLGHTYDEGQWRVNPDVNKRYNALFKYKFDINDWFTAGFRTGFNKTNYNEPHLYGGIGTYWHAIERSKPWQLISTPEGFPQGEGLPMNHSVAYQRYGGRDITETQETNLSAEFEIRPFKGMVINANYSHRNYALQFEGDAKKIEFVTDNTPETVNYLNTANDYIQRISSRTTQDVVDIYGTYSFNIKEKHNFKLLAGYNQTSSEYLEIGALGYGLIKSDIPSVGQITGEDYVSDSNTFTAIRGGFGRFNYNYDEKYFLEVNARYDGSDVFPKDNRFGFFPSASVGWVVSKESFFKNLPINHLKLRVSYGSLGNQDVPADDFRPLLTTRNGTLNYLIDGVEPINILPASLVSSELTWETSTTTNYGIDLGLFKNRFNMSLDVYKRVVSDMIVAGESLPATLGTSAPRTNGADLETNGFELELSWKQKLNNGLTYSIKGYLSDNKTEIIKYNLNPTGRIPNLNNNNILYEGQILGEIWGLDTYGIFQSDEEIATAPDHSPLNGAQRLPGDIRYKDLNGDGEISYGSNTLDDPGDRKIIGNSTPRYNYGFTTTLEYKGFDFNMFFRGVGKKDIAIQNQTPAYFGHAGQNNNLYSTGNHWALENSWTPDNPDAKLPIYKTGSAYNYLTQSRFVESGAFLRLKNITIGYTFPKSIVEKADISNIRIYLSGQNLWTKDNLYGLIDPETLGNLSSTNGKIYPNRKSVAIGLQVSL